MSSDSQPRPESTPIFQPPAPARMLYRSLAFGMDIILALAMLMLATKFIIMPLLGSETRTALLNFMLQYTHIMETAKDSAEAQKAVMAFADDKILIHASITIFWMWFLIIWGYFSLTEWLTQGYTLGKKTFHLRTQHYLLRRPPNLWECLLRGSLKTISLLALLFSVELVLELLTGNANALGVLVLSLPSLDYFIAFYHPSRRTFHDRLTRTCVVEPNHSNLLDTIA